MQVHYPRPVLTARDAARYLSTLDTWLAGDDRLVHGVVPERRGWPRLPFVAVIEAYVLRGLRDAGLSMSQIRRAAAIVRDELKDEYALAHQRIMTDGVDVFVSLADDSFLRANDRQHAFPELLREHLRSIEWAADGTADRLKLRQFPAAADVIIDPRFGWGAPVLGRSKVPVDDIVATWRAGDRLDVIAEEYGLRADVVEDVLRLAA